MTVNVKITNHETSPNGKVADAELHFIGGELDGLRLTGFTIWCRRGAKGCDVSFPARELAVDRRGRQVPFVRSWMDPGATRRLRDLILRCYAQQQLEKHPSSDPVAIRG